MNGSMLILIGALLVGAGCGLGSVARWGLLEGGKYLAARRGEGVREERVRPWATFTANLIACFLLGAIVVRLGSATGSGELVYLLLAAGFCGGLSTLATAALDVVDLVRQGTGSISLGYLLLSAGGGMAALWLGLMVAL